MVSERGGLGLKVVVVAAVFAYFVIYPEDLGDVLLPIDALLRISEAISPGLYGLAAVYLLTKTASRIWGRAPRSS